MKDRNELQKRQEGTDHDPYADIRKVIYDCIDQRIVNHENPDIPLYMIINQNGFLGYITEDQNGEFKGFLNDATLFALKTNFGYVSAESFDDCIKGLTDATNFGYVSAESFDDCIKGLTDAHVSIFHSAWKKSLEKENENNETNNEN